MGRVVSVESPALGSYTGVRRRPESTTQRTPLMVREDSASVVERMTRRLPCASGAIAACCSSKGSAPTYMHVHVCMYACMYACMHVCVCCSSKGSAP